MPGRGAFARPGGARGVAGFEPPQQPDRESGEHRSRARYAEQPSMAVIGKVHTAIASRSSSGSLPCSCRSAITQPNTTMS